MYKKKNRKYKIVLTIIINILMKFVEQICGKVPYVRTNFFVELPII